MSDMLLQALKKKLEGDVAVSKANILIYKEKSVGIGEHPEIVQAIELEVGKMAEAQDKLNEVSTNNVNVMLELAQAQEAYNAALEKLADGKYELALEKIVELAGEAIDTANNIVDPLLADTPTTETPVKKVVKDVANAVSQVAGDPTRGAAKISGMGGLGTFGDQVLQ